jgi:hypothetical protein
MLSSEDEAAKSDYEQAPPAYRHLELMRHGLHRGGGSKLVLPLLADLAAERHCAIRRYPIRKVTTPMPVDGAWRVAHCP